LPLRQEFLQLADRFFAIGENAENHQARFLRQRLEEFARFAGVLGHPIEFRRRFD